MSTRPITIALLGLLAVLAACRPSSGQGDRYVLAISWQPAFCETAPKKPECRSQHARRFDASHFTLHGLWPQPASRTYCAVGRGDIADDKAGDWHRLPMARLPADLWSRLQEKMPGTQSALERHEWLKHGTCMANATPEIYFSASLALLDAVNASPVRKLFAANIARGVSSAEVRRAFDAAFGAGAGGRVRLSCVEDGGRRLIREITIGLQGEIGARPDIASLIAAAPPVDPGCPGGIVDAVGLQ